jgi:hypothetical protein
MQAFSFGSGDTGPKFGTDGCLLFMGFLPRKRKEYYTWLKN